MTVQMTAKYHCLLFITIDVLIQFDTVISKAPWCLLQKVEKKVHEKQNVDYIYIWEG
jgi:hypothetical protein